MLSRFATELKKQNKIPNEYAIIQNIGSFPEGWDEPILNVLILQLFLSEVKE